MSSHDLVLRCCDRRKCFCSKKKRRSFCERVDECVVQDFLSRVFWALPTAVAFEADIGFLRALNLPSLQTLEANDFQQIQTGSEGVNTLQYTGQRIKSFQVLLAGSILLGAGDETVDLQFFLYRGANGALPTEQISTIRALTIIPGGGQANLSAVGGLTLNPGDTLVWYFINNAALPSGSVLFNFATTVSYW